MISRHLVAALPAIMLLALSACGSSPVVRYYTLNAAPAAGVGNASSAASYSVSVAMATVPEAVDRPQLVVRVNPNRVDILEDQRWAEALKREIPRVIAEDLAQRLSPARVAAYPQHAAENPTYTVLLDVQRFDSAPNEAATLEVIWTLRREPDNVLRDLSTTPSTTASPAAARPPVVSAVRTTRSVLREATAGGSFDALAAAHSRALATLSDEIAQAIRTDAAKY